MREHHIRHLPVLEDDDALLGVLSIRDLVLEEIEEVRRYLHLEEG
ncbi:MAG: CBS domain-containing protein [Planctomycetota bacterium]|nr:CBS domain-containing protein [Planctomycetota bacterium]